MKRSSYSNKYDILQEVKTNRHQTRALCAKCENAYVSNTKRWISDAYDRLYPYSVPWIRGERRYNLHNNRVDIFADTVLYL